MLATVNTATCGTHLVTATWCTWTCREGRIKARSASAHSPMDPRDPDQRITHHGWNTSAGTWKEALCVSSKNPANTNSAGTSLVLQQQLRFEICIHIAPWTTHTDIHRHSHLLVWKA